MEDCVLLDCGSGGRASQRLINRIFLSHFKNPVLETMDDAALLNLQSSKVAMSTDGYTVSPLFFPGGSIGTLAVNGTVNDIAMLGAVPRWLTAAFIIEEGLPISVLEAVAEDMARECEAANVRIACGDTKVVPHGSCDKLFITTSGIGEIYASTPPSGHNARPGDAILINGNIGDHGLAVMAAREDVSFLSEVRSDCAPLGHFIFQLLKEVPEIHALRDPTRGGLATTLNEIAEQSGVGIEINESLVPIDSLVADGCSFLGLDPLYLANEGKCICFVPLEKAEKALACMRAMPEGKNAAMIGTVSDAHPGKVVMTTAIGGKRFLGMLEGAQLPRIC